MVGARDDARGAVNADGGHEWLIKRSRATEISEQASEPIHIEMRAVKQHQRRHGRDTLRYLLPALLYTLHVLRSSANGSASSHAVAAFAPSPPRFHVHRRTPLQQPARFDYMNTHRKSSTSGSVATDIAAGKRRGDPKPISKIKSPSNSYNQFQKEGVLVGIERTSPNSRRISGEMIMDIPTEDIWSILTDYDNLSTHVPNLVESKVINNGGRIVGGRPRVYQRGAQRIFGFEFGADVTLDMTEYVHHGQTDAGTKMYSIAFECVDSQFFSQFDGSWILEEYSNGKTMVRYIVDIKPKGPVPVPALEWRIKEDVPTNILAVSKSSSARAAARRAMEQSSALDLEQAMAVPETEVQPVPQPQPAREKINPLQQLANQAAYILKQTAKTTLPTPVVSTAKQAIRAINNSNSVGTMRSRPVPTMSLTGGRRNGSSNELKPSPRGRRAKKRQLSMDTEVEWYQDETMGMYLKDFE